MNFIKIHTKNYIVVHGYDEHNKEIEETIEVNEPTEKLIAVNRILSISEKYILTSYAHNRIIYCQYEEDFKQIQAQLKLQGFLIN